MNSDRGDGICSLMEELKLEIRRTDHLCYPSYISRFYDELALLKFITKKKKTTKTKTKTIAKNPFQAPII